MNAVTFAALAGPSIDWLSLSPLLVMLGAGMALLVVSSLTPTWPRGLAAVVGVVTMLAAGALTIVLWRQVDREGPADLVAAALRLDRITLWLLLAVVVSLVLAVLASDDYLARERLDVPETYALYLLAAIGAVTMGAANDLVVLFLGIEIMSIALYVLAASHRRRVESQESGLKYFVLGSFSSAFLLYGIALIYGATGSTNYRSIVTAFDTAIAVDRADETLVLAGVALLLVGLAFKVAAVPFHIGMPDIYQGAPTPVTAMMASLGKAAAMVAMLRVLVVPLGPWVDDHRPAVWLLAALTLFVGSTLAVVQPDVKRMLAFSSISHAGFMLVGLEAALKQPGDLSSDGAGSVLFYMFVYAVLAVGSFAVVTLVSRTGDAATDLGAFRGLGRSHPLLALGFTVLLLAQAGVPLTSGFVSKVAVISAAVEGHSYVLAVGAMVAAVIAAYLYLRIIVTMWAADDAERTALRVPGFIAAALGISVVVTLALGIYPGPLLDLLP